MDRSHLVLAAAAACAALAVFQAVRESETGEPAPVESAAGEVALAPDVSAAPVGPVEVGAAVRVHGEVTNPRGDRVPGVRIELAGGEPAASVTDTSGAYELHLEPRGNDSLALRFSADGYQDAEARLEPSALRTGQVRLDVRLEPRPGAVVSGTLTTRRGSPIAGETIHLESAASGARHAALSGADGSFFVPGVAPGPGYYLFVRPKARYQDFQQSVAVGGEGLSLDIALRELVTLRVTGRLVDPQGRPIPDLALSVTSGQALERRLETRSDARGEFVVDGVPSGHLSFSAAPPDPLVISGVRLAPDSDGVVLLRADWGAGELRGRVVGEGGRPLAGAEVELSWSYVGEEASSRSNRIVVTDAGGLFEFRRLGDGVHRLDVRAPGHRELQLDYEVSAESPGLELALEPVREQG